MKRRRRLTIHNFVSKVFGMIGGALTTGAAIWYLTGEPGHGRGLVIWWLIEIPLYPLFSMTVASVRPAVLTGLLVPRAYRIRYRQKHGRAGAKSARISQRLRNAIYFADHYRCISCGARTDLQIDHGIPWAGGGVTSVVNCFTLCGKENRIKSNYSVDRDGYIHYREYTVDAKLSGVSRSDKMEWAARILAIENRKRWNLMRWLRMSWAMV